MAARKTYMKTITQLLLLLALVATGAGSPSLHARTNRPRVVKSIDISDDPAVNAAEKRRSEAVKALTEAEAKRDKTAIQAAQKEKEEATKALHEARKSAFAAAKKKQNR